MANLISTVGLEPLLTKAGLAELGRDNFELAYDRLASNDKLNEVRSDVDRLVRRYFASLELPAHATLYDYLLLTLRPKDLIATFNWDPLLLQAYARNRHMRLPRVVFLHGNVYLGFCPEHRNKGYLTQRCQTCQRPLEPSPLLFPITKKEYRSHPLLANEWEELSKTLEHAYLLTIFGYAAPNSDAAAKEILLNAWSANETRELAQIEVIDILPRGVLNKRWGDFIVRQHWGSAKRFTNIWQARYPRRSCETLAFATLQQSPWHERRVPRFRRLDRLQAWFQPLLDQEEALEKRNAPLEPFRPPSG